MNLNVTRRIDKKNIPTNRAHKIIAMNGMNAHSEIRHQNIFIKYQMATAKAKERLISQKSNYFIHSIESRLPAVLYMLAEEKKHTRKKNERAKKKAKCLFQLHTL